MFYDGHRRLICEAFCSAEPQVAPQAALSPFGEPVRYVRSADAQPEVSRRSRARSQTHNSRALCSAVWPNVQCTGMLFRLAFGQSVHFCHRSLVCSCTHAEIRTHACSVPRLVVVSRSESVASVRFRLCSMRLGSSYVRGWARAELGSTFEPCHVSGCLEHAKTHRNRLVVVVFSQSIVQSSRSDPPSPLVIGSARHALERLRLEHGGARVVVSSARDRLGLAR